MLVLLLPPAEVPAFWADCWRLEWETEPPFENVEPTDPLEVLIADDILADEVVSLMDAIYSSGRKSDDEDDGASVPTEDPTG